MKISANTYDDLAAAVRLLVRGRSERERWDALWASNFDVRRLYAEGLNDSHIDTALRRVQLSGE